MIMTNFYKSFLNKIDTLFCGVNITDIISISDEYDDLIDNTIFLEIDNHKVIGFYINGMNPYITRNRISEFDDFNLYALYSQLKENKLGIPSSFTVGHIKVIFNPDYDEVVAIYLSSSDCSSSILIIFSVDELYIYNDFGEKDLIRLIREKLFQYENTDFLIFQKSLTDSDWLKS